MSVSNRFDIESKESNGLRWSAILLMMVIATSCLIDTGTLVNAHASTDLIESADHSLSFIGTGGNAAVVAGGLQTSPRPALADGTLKPRSYWILKEVAKQAVDQPGHFLIAATPIWMSRHLVGVPWYGWAIAPLLAYREWRQWPSNRWWDPPLDWIFLSLGVLVATCRRGPRRGLPAGQPTLPRRIARGLSFGWARRGGGRPDLADAHAGLSARTRRQVNAPAKAGFRR